MRGASRTAARRPPRQGARASAVETHSRSTCPGMHICPCTSAPREHSARPCMHATLGVGPSSAVGLAAPAASVRHRPCRPAYPARHCGSPSTATKTTATIQQTTTTTTTAPTNRAHRDADARGRPGDGRMPDRAGRRLHVRPSPYHKGHLSQRQRGHGPRRGLSSASWAARVWNLCSAPGTASRACRNAGVGL